MRSTLSQNALEIFYNGLSWSLIMCKVRKKHLILNWECTPLDLAG